MSVGTARIIEYYDGMLPSMEGYFTTTNARLERAKDTLSRIVLAGSSVLDVGCGVGITSKHMAELGADVTAVDISPDLIKSAAKNSSHDRVSYHCADICEFKSSKKYDYITFTDVIEHIDRHSVPKMIKRLSSVNSSDRTRVYINIPNAIFTRYMMASNSNKLQIIDEPWSVNEIVFMFAQNGFEPILIQAYGLDTDIQYDEYIFIKTSLIASRYCDQLRGRI